MSYTDIFQINYQYQLKNYKQNKITKAIKVSFYSILATLISQFLVWGLEYGLLKGLTNEEKENLEIYDYITSVIIAALNGFMSVYIPRDAFLFVASINSVVISNLLYIYFNGEKEGFSLVEELIITIITVIIIFKIILRLFNNKKIFKDKDSIGYLIFINIILNIALTIDFSVYNQIFNKNTNRSQVLINESVDI
jgi:hypothetical protein